MKKLSRNKLFNTQTTPTPVPTPDPFDVGGTDGDDVVDMALSQEHADPIKQAMANVLTMITNNYYKVEEITHDIIVQISSKPGKNGKIKDQSNNYYDQQYIVLADGLLDAFKALDLPRFSVYYHELGHHLYSQGMFDLVDAWKARPVSVGDPIQYENHYFHLLNWIEDYHIEQKLINDKPYTKDILTCIKKLPPGYNITDIKYAFNFFYVNQAVTPALSHVDGLSFLAYINKLLGLRNVSSIRFGKGPITVLTATGKLSTETQFVKLIIEFYNWCVSVGIFDPAQPPMPALDNPNQHIEVGAGNGQGTNGAGPGTYTPHTGAVGKSNKYVLAPHIKSPTQVFKDQIAAEKRMIQKELLDMSQRLQADNSTLDGLFNAKYHESSFIQPRVIVPNFFHPARLADMVLFKEKEHTYMNVAIFRDVSGSTSGTRHTMMHVVCEQLYADIPVDISYYLYASGDVSIGLFPYVSWPDSGKVPDVYTDDPIYQQMGGGTNSDAIADAVTEQLSEKWLNIVITDGDLDRLLARSNIEGLMKNVFVIHVDESDAPDVFENKFLGIRIKDTADVARINDVLSTINLR